MAKSPRKEVDRVEDSACRMALRHAGISAAKICHMAGIEVASKIKFEHLRDYADFPEGPIVSGVEPDPPAALLTKFHKTALWDAWVETWDEQPDTRQGERVMLVKGLVWGVIIVADDVQCGDTPHILLGDSKTEKLTLTAFPHWLTQLHWPDDFETRVGGDYDDMPY